MKNYSGFCHLTIIITPPYGIQLLTGHPVDSHFWPTLSHILYPMALQWPEGTERALSNPNKQTNSWSHNWSYSFWDYEDFKNCYFQGCGAVHFCRPLLGRLRLRLGLRGTIPALAPAHGKMSRRLRLRFRVNKKRYRVLRLSSCYGFVHPKHFLL